jgi:hypothetical protein
VLHNSPNSLGSHSPGPHHAVGAPRSSTQGLSASSLLLRRSRVPSRGEQTPHALNFPFSAMLSAQSLAQIELRRRRAPPPQTVPSSAFMSVSCPRLSPPCHPGSPEPFPSALDPHSGRVHASGETSPRSRAAPPRAFRQPQPELAIRSQASI